MAIAAALLETAAQQMPRIWLQQQQDLLQLFACDFYVVRKALLECLKVLILKAHSICDLDEPETEAETEEETEGDTGKETLTRRRSLLPGGEGWLESDDEGSIREDSNRLSSPLVAVPTGQRDNNNYHPHHHHHHQQQQQQQQQQRVRFWKAQRQQLLRLLLLRLQDKLPLARSWCLKSLGELLEGGALSPAAIAAVAAATAERVRDKSSLVRAAALQVIATCLSVAVRQQQQQEFDQPFVLLLADEFGEWRQRYQQQLLQQQQQQLLQQQQQQLRAAADAAAAPAAAASAASQQEETSEETEGMDGEGAPKQPPAATPAAAAAAAEEEEGPAVGGGGGVQEGDDPMLRLVVAAEDALDAALSM